MNQSEIIEAFRENKHSFQNFRTTLCSLIEEILLSNNINYAFVRGRVKTVESLKGNFSGDLYKKKAIDKLNDIHDIVGCRVVFYLSEDVTAFLTILREEFKILEEKNKESLDEYQGYHAICKLTANRIKLSEYKKYKEIPFELQLTTVLHHGWNELDHDLFYKDKEGLKKRYLGLFTKLRDESRQIMQNYLIPAQEAWEGLVKDYSVGLKNQEIYSPNYLKSLAVLSDNNKIYDALKEVKEKSYAVGLPEKLDIPKTIESFGVIIEKSKTNKLKNDRSLFGYFTGKTHEDVIQPILDLTKHLFYANPELVIQFLLRQYLGSTTDGIKNNISKLLSDLAEYDNEILQRFGFAYQYKFLEIFKKQSVSERIALLQIICEVSNAVFENEFRDARTFFDENEKVIKINSSNYTFIPENTNHLKLKEDYIKFLMMLYKKLDTFGQQVKVIDSLSRNLYSINPQRIIDFLLKQVTDRTSVELLSKIEDTLVWAKNEPAETDFLAKVETHPVYPKFRILVGYDRNIDFNMSWDQARTFRFNETEKWIENYNENSKNIDAVIEVALKSYERIQDASAYINFNDFLERFSKKHTTAALKLYKKHGKSANAVLMSSVVIGLMNSKLPLSVKENLVASSNAHTILNFALALRRIDSKRLRVLILTFILKSKQYSQQQKINIYHSVLCSLGFFEITQTSKYLELMKFLISKDKFGWSGCYFGSRDGKPTVFDVFASKQWDEFLKLYVKKERIDFHDHYILEALSNTYPIKILGFFKQRLAYEEELKSSKEKGRYSAVPYDDRELHKIFEQHASLFVDGILEWFDEFDGWKAAHALEGFYPNLNPQIEKRLREIIDKKDKKIWKEKVASLFTWYEAYALEPLIEYTIKKFPKDADIWNNCISHLMNPGAVSGSAAEPIMANAIEKRLQSVRKWTQETKKMKDFIAEVEKYALQRIETEKVSHNKELLTHKRNYPKAP